MSRGGRAFRGEGRRRSAATVSAAAAAIVALRPLSPPSPPSPASRSPSSAPHATGKMAPGKGGAGAPSGEGGDGMEHLRIRRGAAATSQQCRRQRRFKYRCAPAALESGNVLRVLSAAHSFDFF